MRVTSPSFELTALLTRAELRMKLTIFLALLLSFPSNNLASWVTGYSKKCLLPLTRHSVVLSLLLAWIRLICFLQDLIIVAGSICAIGASQVALVVKNLPANARDLRDADSIPGSETSPGKGHRQPTLVFLPEESDRGAWQATVHRITKSWAQLMLLSTHTCVQYTLNTLAFSWKFLKALALVGS